MQPRFFYPSQNGFSLIEMLIVIAIIGVLAAFAALMYHDYLVKAQVNRVYYEINSARTIVDSILSEGVMPTLDPTKDGATENGQKFEYIGVNQNDLASNLIYQAKINQSGGTFKSIGATFGKNAYAGIKDAQLIIERDPQGYWVCKIQAGNSAWKEKYTPPTCQNI